MNKSLIICGLAIFVFLGLTPAARAAIVSGWDEWEITLDANEGFTCIAHFVLGSVEFTQAPVQTETYIAGGYWEDIGWQSTLSTDNKIAYMYGPLSTNTTGNDDVPWFSYELFYQWDDAVEDPAYPVYIDTAIYDGGPGSPPTDYWGWRGIPGDPGSWRYQDWPFHLDDPDYEEGFYDNPVPEPMTICLLGLGVAFLRKRR